MQNGPVVLEFEAYEDLQYYKSGIFPISSRSVPALYERKKGTLF